MPVESNHTINLVFLVSVSFLTGFRNGEQLPNQLETSKVLVLVCVMPSRLQSNGSVIFYQ